MTVLICSDFQGNCRCCRDLGHNESGKDSLTHRCSCGFEWEGGNPITAMSGESPVDWETTATGTEVYLRDNPALCGKYVTHFEGGQIVVELHRTLRRLAFDGQLWSTREGEKA